MPYAREGRRSSIDRRPKSRRSRIVRSIGCSACVLAIAACSTPPRDAREAFGTNAYAGSDAATAPSVLVPFDPVAFVERGERVEGSPALEIEEAGFRYRFADEASRAAFLAVERTPPRAPRYRVAMGGGCGRMGALTGCGDPARAVAFDGRLHLFASESCRATFERDPAAFVERFERGTAIDGDTRVRGEALAARVVRRLGGDRIDAGASVELVSTRTERAGDRDYTVVRRHAATSALGYLEFESWDEWASWVEADLGRGRGTGRLDGSSSEARALDGEQIVAFARQALWEPAFTALLLAGGDARCTAAGPSAWTLGDGRVVEGEVLAIDWRHARIEWIVDPADGLPLAARGLRRLADGRFGEDLVAFGAWTSAGALAVPLERTARDGSTTRFASARIRG